jgi:hypothetical protein
VAECRSKPISVDLQGDSLKDYGPRHVHLKKAAFYFRYGPFSFHLRFRKWGVAVEKLDLRKVRRKTLR